MSNLSNWPEYLSQARQANWSRIGLDQIELGSSGNGLAILVRSTGDLSRARKLWRSLLEAIPGFEGEITFVSKGSALGLGLLIDPATEVLARCRIGTMSGDLWTGSGANAAIEETRSPWVLLIDDDLSFVSDVIRALDDIVRNSFSSFFSVAVETPDAELRVASRLLGYPERSAVRFRLVDTDELAHLEKINPALPSAGALWLGPVLLNVETFKSLGGFDPGLRDGAERLDLSLRLHRARVPVVSAPTPGLRCKAELTPESYVADFGNFFASPLNRDQRDLFSAKHNVAVAELSPANFLTLARSYTKPFSKADGLRHVEEPRPRIALIIDWDNWAFASISRQIIKYTSDRFEYVVIPSVCVTNPAHMLMMCEDCDLVHVFYRPYIDWLYGIYGQTYLKDFGINPEERIHRLLGSKIVTTGIYDHLFLDEEFFSRMKFLINDVFAGYYVSSNKLAKIYRNIPEFRTPNAVIPDGVDLQRFQPRNLRRFEEGLDRELVVGWVGNSQWRSDLEDMKGVHSILLPAIDVVNAGGPLLRTHFADRHTTYVPPEEMPAYYNQIDVLVCASKIEGTPNPVLEAMACGVPIISTDVGVVPDVFGPLQKRFLLRERTVESMSAALRDLESNRGLLVELSRENLRSIQSWDWEIMVKPFAVFFEEALRSRVGSRSLRRPGVGLG